MLLRLALAVPACRARARSSGYRLLDTNGAPLSIRLADEAAKGAVSALIPFRWLVREVSGAASNDRKLRVAHTTGIARRAYLKGIRMGRGCRA